MFPSTKRFCRAFGITVSLFCASAQSNDGFVTGESGLTFYTFDDDVAGTGTSACDEYCLERWPAVPANAASGKEFSSIQREDGSRQLAYYGQPLYYYRYDHKPGDARGDGKGGLWHALRIRQRPVTQAEQKKDPRYRY